MKSYIEDKEKLYAAVLDFLQSSDDHGLENFSINMKNYKLEEDPEEMLEFLQIIKNISDNHHRERYFHTKINQILFHYKDQIKQTFSNIDIFHIFENNKAIVLFLLKNDIIRITSQLYKEMTFKRQLNGIRYWNFFYPEIEKFVGAEKFASVKNEFMKNEANIFDNFDEKRKEGENESQLCSLIRQDSIDEFISYINLECISPTSEISPSIFETNQFLIDKKKITLIEYAAFFGSIQIFQYLLNNGVKLESSLWFYAIHSNNAELIYLLESKNVSPPNNDYFECFIESIKCHHNDVANYIENNFINQKDSQEKNFSICLKYHNYSYLQLDNITDNLFFNLCYYRYNKIVDLYLKEKSNEFDYKIIKKNFF